MHMALRKLFRRLAGQCRAASLTGHLVCGQFSSAQAQSKINVRTGEKATSAFP